MNTTNTANPASTNGSGPMEVEVVKCECCGLKEECTPAYIARVRDRFYGRFVCGLCAEAVKEELCRAESRIGLEDALKAHMQFCAQFNANPAVNVPEALCRLLRRRFESPKALRSTHSGSNLGDDARSTTCFSTFSR